MGVHRESAAVPFSPGDQMVSLSLHTTVSDIITLGQWAREGERDRERDRERETERDRERS